MKRVTIGMLLMLTASFNPLRAQGLSRETAFESLGVVESDPALLGKRHSLFFELTDEDLAWGPVTVEFMVKVATKLFLLERLTVEAQGAQLRPAVEFLALDPLRLEELFRVAAQRKRVSITVTVADRKVGEFSFQEFVSYNRARETSFHPIAALSTSVWPERRGVVGDTGVHAKGYFACRNQCYQNVQQCEANCLRNPNPTCEINCDNRLDNCLALCTCPTTTAVEGSPEFQGYTGTGFEACRKREFFSGRRWHTELYRRYKVTQYQRTENCDDSVTQTPTGYYYIYECCCYLETTRSCPSSGPQAACYAH